MERFPLPLHFLTQDPTDSLDLDSFSWTGGDGALNGGMTSVGYVPDVVLSSSPSSLRIWGPKREEGRRIEGGFEGKLV